MNLLWLLQYRLLLALLRAKWSTLHRWRLRFRVGSVVLRNRDSSMARRSHDECLMGSLSWGRPHSLVLLRRKVDRHQFIAICQLLLLLVHQIVVRKALYSSSVHLLLRHVLGILTTWIQIHSDVVLQVRWASSPLRWRRNLRVVHISIVYRALNANVRSTTNVFLLFILDLTTVMPHSAHNLLVIINHRTCVLASSQAENGPWTWIRWVSASSHNDLFIIASSNRVVLIGTATRCRRTDLIWAKIGLPSSNSSGNQIMHRHFVSLVLSSLWRRTFNLSWVPIVIKWAFRGLFVGSKLVPERSSSIIIIISLSILIQIP